MDAPAYLYEDLKAMVGPQAWEFATGQDQVNLAALSFIRRAVDDEASEPAVGVRGALRRSDPRSGHLNVWLEIGDVPHPVEATVSAEGYLLFSRDFLEAVDRYAGSQERGSDRLSRYRLKIKIEHQRTIGFVATQRVIDPAVLDAIRRAHRESPLSKFLLEKIAGVSAPTAHM